MSSASTDVARILEQNLHNGWNRKCSYSFNDDCLRLAVKIHGRRKRLNERSTPLIRSRAFRTIEEHRNDLPSAPKCVAIQLTVVLNTKKLVFSTISIGGTIERQVVFLLLSSSSLCSLSFFLLCDRYTKTYLSHPLCVVIFDLTHGQHMFCNNRW